MKNQKRKKRTRIIPYESDNPADQLQTDNAHTPNPTLGRHYLDETRRQALEESKRRIAENTITPTKPNFQIWHKGAKK